MTAGKTYDPFAIERPKLRLGSHGEWELGEMHDARHARFQEWHERFNKTAERDDVKIADLARLTGEMIDIACIDASAAPAILVDLCDGEKHGENARGFQTLAGIVGFIAEQVTGEVTAGEG